MKKFSIILLVLLNIKCTNRVDNSKIDFEGVHSIVISNINSETVNLSNIDIIYLKPNSYSEIGLIMKIIDLGDRYIVSDKMKGNAIFIYDVDGNYINHIHRPGQGPGEYRNIENIYYKQITNELVLVPMDERKKMFFDLEGNFQREEFFRSSIWYADLVFFGHEELIANHAHMDNGNNLILLQNDVIKSKFLPYDKNLDDVQINRNNVLAFDTHNTVLLSMGTRDTLYIYNHYNNNLSPKYIIDFDNKKLDLSLDESNYIEEGYIGLFNIFQNEKFLSFSTFTHDDIVVFFYDKLEHKLHSGKNVFKGLLENAQIRFIVGMTQDNKFIGVIEPDKAEPLVFKNQKKLQKTYDGFNISDPDDKLLLIFDFEPK